MLHPSVNKFFGARWALVRCVSFAEAGVLQH